MDMVTSEISTNNIFLTASATAICIGLAAIFLARSSSRRLRGCTFFMSMPATLLFWLRTRLILRYKHLAIVNSREECSPALNRILRECREYQYVGFDCEWRPQTARGQRQRPVALLQLASPQGSCALFRLCNIGFIPDEVKAILRDAKLLKVGVAPLDDARLLLKDYGAPVKGCFDLRHLVASSRTQVNVFENQEKFNFSDTLIQTSTYDIGKDPQLQSSVENNDISPNTGNGEKVGDTVKSSTKSGPVTLTMKETSSINIRATKNGGPGLAKLAEHVLGVTLDKNWHTRCSDWEADTLSPEQVRYAVNDALVSAKIFARLTGLSQSWWPPWRRNDEKPSWEQILLKYSHYTDAAFRPRTKIGMSITSKKQLLKKPQPTLKTQSRALASFSARQKPLYDNCFLLDPDGEVLCSCKKSRAEWYLSKGLAEIVEKQDEKLVVKLKFKPSISIPQNTSDFKYYTLYKLNICVVCGTDQSCVKKWIVPQEYRVHFPKSAKDYQSHDVLLMCVLCSVRANMTSELVKKELAVFCNTPVSIQRFIMQHPVRKVRSAANALYKVQQLSSERKQELNNIVADYFQLPASIDVPEEVLKQARELDIKKENTEYEPHGLRVVRHFQTQYGEKEGIHELQRIWRSRFLETMRPQYLPELWSVDHRLNY